MNLTEGEKRNEWPGKEISAFVPSGPGRGERMTPEPKVLTPHQSPLGARPGPAGLAGRLLGQHVRGACCPVRLISAEASCALDLELPTELGVRSLHGRRGAAIRGDSGPGTIDTELTESPPGRVHPG